LIVPPRSVAKDYFLIFFGIAFIAIKTINCNDNDRNRLEQLKQERKGNAADQ
jgi:hypothetical protein